MDEYYSVIQFLPEPLRTELKAMPPECAACVQEIRLRAGQAVQFTVGGAWQPAQQLLPAAQTALAIGPRMLRSCFAACVSRYLRMYSAGRFRQSKNFSVMQRRKRSAGHEKNVVSAASLRLADRGCV